MFDCRPADSRKGGQILGQQAGLPGTQPAKPELMLQAFAALGHSRALNLAARCADRIQNVNRQSEPVLGCDDEQMGEGEPRKSIWELVSREVFNSRF